MGMNSWLAWAGLRSLALAVVVLQLTSCWYDPHGGAVISTYKVDAAALPADEPAESLHAKYSSELTCRRMYQGIEVFYNASTATYSLDIADPEGETANAYNELYPEFGTAYFMSEVQSHHAALPSIDLLDFNNKCNDDRLLTAIERGLHEGPALYPGGKQGFLAALRSRVVARPASSDQQLALAYLDTALALGDGSENKAASAEVRRISRDFDALPSRSKPIGFYDDDAMLQRIFRRDRLLSQPLAFDKPPGLELEIGSPDEELAALCLLAQELQADPLLLRAYEDYCECHRIISNPPEVLDLRDLLPHLALAGQWSALRQRLESSPVWQSRILANGANPGIAFWPRSTSPESVLFNQMSSAQFESAQLMEYLRESIRSGSVSLEPADNSGWYSDQLFALETLLLPERAQEAGKLQLSGRYQQRLGRAFEAMLSQRREGQVKMLGPFAKTKGGERASALPEKLAFAMEPAPTISLRTARAYRRLSRQMQDLPGLGRLDIENEGGAGEGSQLGAEIERLCALQYGLYLLSCSDIGLPAELEENELASCPSLDMETVVEEQSDAEELADLGARFNLYPVRSEPGLDPDEALRRLRACERARDWLINLDSDPFLKNDPRSIVPIGQGDSKRIKCWAVLGVKMLKFKAAYVTPPRMVLASTYKGLGSSEDQLRKADADLAASIGLWPGYDQEVQEATMPVYVFREVEIGSTPLSRSEFRKICDREKEPDKIVAALAKLR